MNKQTDRQTDNANSRVALQLKIPQDLSILIKVLFVCVSVCVSVNNFSVSLTAISPSMIFRPSVCPSVSYKDQC